jgi:predicted Zn-dependent protease
VRNRISALRSQALALIVLACLAAPAAAADPSNPYDKFRKATYSNKGLMNEQDEMRLGAQVHQQVLQKYRLNQDPEITSYVQNLGERLARASRRPDLPYRFYVIDDASVNAFSIPGGYVYVNTGLLNITQSEDELAAAIAHEIGHVVARHGLRNIKKAQHTALLFGILGVGADIATGGSGVGRAAGELLAAGVITKNSRDFEREADYLGLYNMAALGYDPEGMVRIFQRLGASTSAKGSGGMGGIFASHPDSGERGHNTETEIQQHLAGTLASHAPQAAPGGDGRTRSRRASTGHVSSGSTGEFAAMKQALNSYAGSYHTNRQGQGRNARYDPNYDPRRDPSYNPNDPDNQPASNDRPVLKRRP